MDERAQRIVETAMALAERDGFASVRLRDVAAHAQVALGTVYKRFSSKEEILIAALEQQAARMQDKIVKRAMQGDTPYARVTNFFSALTKGLTKRPNLARALVRAIATADTKITHRVVSFHGLTTALVMSSIRGTSPEDTRDWGGEADTEVRLAAGVLQQVWFASLVGWAGGLHDVDTIDTQVNVAARLVLSTKER